MSSTTTSASTATATSSSVPTHTLNIPLVVSLGVIVPLFFILVLCISFRSKLTSSYLALRKWSLLSAHRRRSTAGAAGGVMVAEPVMSQRPGTEGAATGTGQAERERRRERRRRNPSIRTVPEYSADAGDTEIVLARAAPKEDPPSSRRRPSDVQEEEDEERQGLLLTRSSTTRTGGSSEQTHGTGTSGRQSFGEAGFTEVDLSGPTTRDGSDNHVTIQIEDEPAEPPPTYESPLTPTFSSIPLGTIAPGPPITTTPIRGHRASRSEASALSVETFATATSGAGRVGMPRTTTSNSDLASDDQAAHGRQRSSTFRSLFQSVVPQNASSSSLLPTHVDGGRRRGSEGEAGRASPRPPSAFRIRHGRFNSSSTSLTPPPPAMTSSPSSSPGIPSSSRPRASSSASQLQISSPLPASFHASSYVYPASGPTPEQMRFLGSVEEMSRLGVGPHGASRSSLALSRTRSGSVGGGGNEGRASAEGVREEEEEAPPPPFEEREGQRRSEGEEQTRGHRTAYSGPLLMPSFPAPAPASSDPAASTSTSAAAARTPAPRPSSAR